MKIKLTQEQNDDDPLDISEKFCWLPTWACDERMNTSWYLVWMETVYWNKAYKSWSIIVPYNKIPRY